MGFERVDPQEIELQKSLTLINFSCARKAPIFQKAFLFGQLFVD
jgi:hypothetical protein